MENVTGKRVFNSKNFLGKRLPFPLFSTYTTPTLEEVVMEAKLCGYERRGEVRGGEDGVVKWGRAVNARKDQKGKASIPFLFRTFTLALSLFKVREKKNSSNKASHTQRVWENATVEKCQGTDQFI